MARVHLGVDLGGSAIKAGLVDAAAGTPVSEIVSVPTPRPSTPQLVVDAVRQIAVRLGGEGSVGFAFPSVVKDGKALTAANVDAAWIEVDGGALLASAIGRPVAFLNDADAAGLAEMRFGAGHGARGTVLVLTFGTGIGSAPFIDGRLLPNTEFGHLEMLGMDAEQWASARIRREQSLDWPAWAARVNDYLARMEALFWPDLFIIGGAIVECYAEFAPFLATRAEIRPAALGPAAGVIGAAVAAAELR